MDHAESLLRKDIYEFLCQHNVLNLAYINNGKPGCSAVWFAATEDLLLYYVSSTNTSHGSALKGGGSVSFTIQKDDQDWRMIKGVQGTGYSELVPPERRATAWQTYSKRFPFVLQPLADLAQALSVISLWSIYPDWMRLIDNTKGFGHKEELYLHANDTLN